MVQTLVGIARIVESQSTAAHMFRAVVAGFELFSADAQGVRDVGTMEVATKSGERHSAKRDELFFDEICGFQFFNSLLFALLLALIMWTLSAPSRYLKHLSLVLARVAKKHDEGGKNESFCTYDFRTLQEKRGAFSGVWCCFHGGKQHNVDPMAACDFCPLYLGFVLRVSV